MLNPQPRRRSEMSFTDDAREPEALIETPQDLAELMRVIRLGKAIRETAERRHEAGKTEPRSLGG